VATGWNSKQNNNEPPLTLGYINHSESEGIVFAV